MNKTIFAIGIESFPGGDDHQLVKCYSYRTHVSLMDADIVILTPNLHSHLYSMSDDSFAISDRKYLGKPCLTENGSGCFLDDHSYWKKEISKAIDAGKTIFFLSELPSQFYYKTGEKQTSGTGRNQKVSHIVNLFNSYSLISFLGDQIHTGSGSEITYRNSSSLLRALWEENKKYFHYQVSYSPESFKGEPFFFQKKGNDVLGGLFKMKTGAHMIVLPAIELEHSDFTELKKDPETGENLYYWTKEATIFTSKITKAFVEIDKQLRAESNLTPPPNWLDSNEFEIQKVCVIDDQIQVTDEKIARLSVEKENLVQLREQALLPRRLLFEGGKALETSVLDALRMIGFEAKSFEDAESEFDVLFYSAEGQCLGEVEGKDTKPVDVTKISQLIRNLGEYLVKDGVTEPAKGVLFGNGCRLLSPQERKDHFTEKCIRTSEQQNIALVRTIDLFPLVQYLNMNDDEKFKAACRRAILETKGGVVTFPAK